MLFKASSKQSKAFFISYDLIWKKKQKTRYLPISKLNTQIKKIKKDLINMF